MPWSEEDEEKLRKVEILAPIAGMHIRAAIASAEEQRRRGKQWLADFQRRNREQAAELMARVYDGPFLRALGIDPGDPNV